MSLGGLFSGSKRRRTKKIAKLKTLLSLAVSRMGLLKNQHQVRCSMAHGDIAHLLQLGHSDRALLLADRVIKEDNMLDVFALIQSYCHLLSERASLIQHQKECPDELKEAVSSLIYASTRSGEMPELQYVCRLFASMYGREFVNAATELRNNCGVNSKIVQKLSTRQPSVESKVRIIKEIAAEKGITLDLIYEDPDAPAPIDTISTQNKKPTSDRISTSEKLKPNYKDVASAAQAAFEKAEDAVAAARVAAELTRSSYAFDSDDDHNNQGNEDQKKDLSEKEEEPVLYSVEKRGINNKMMFVDKFSSGFNSDSTDAPLKEKKLNAFEPRASMKSNDKKNETESEKDEPVLYSDEKGGFSSSDAFMGKFSSGFNSNSTDAPLREKKLNEFESNETESEKEFSLDSLMNPLIQKKKNPARKYRDDFENSVNAESDTEGSLNAADENVFIKSYYAEATSPENYTKKPSVQQTKVTKRAFSMRTRRGMHK